MFLLARIAITATLISVLGAALAAQSNGSFESGLSGWTANPAGAAIVTSATESFFPTEGGSYLQLTPLGSDDATAGYGPHSAGSGLGLVSKVSREFVVPDGGQVTVQIDWNFLLDDAPGGIYDDFLSVDIIDVNTGGLVQNVVFIDNGTAAGAPLYSNVPAAVAGELRFVDALRVTGGFSEVLPRGFKRARADLSSVSAGTLLRLEISAGNGTDEIAAPRVLIDNFRVLNGGVNTTSGSLRVLGASSVDGALVAGDAGSDLSAVGPIEFGARPGQRVALRHSTGLSDRAFVLLSGTVNNDGSDFGYGDFNLRVSDPIVVLVDGLNPTTPLDALVGRTGTDANFIQGALPTDALPGEVGFASVFEDPTNGPIFLRTSATTRMTIKTNIERPRGAIELETDAGAPLSNNSFGRIPLASLSGGGFEFYGTTYTQCYISDNGFLTFTGGDIDASPTITEMYTQEPRIAVMWENFTPTGTATPTVNFRLADAVQDTIVVSWDGIRHFSDDAPANRFSVELHGDGSISMYYDSLTIDHGLVGITPGSLPSPTGALVSTIDFSGASLRGGNFLTTSSSQPVLEHFGASQALFGGAIDRNDIMTVGESGPARICFVPGDSNNYEVFAGVR